MRAGGPTAWEQLVAASRCASVRASVVAALALPGEVGMHSAALHAPCPGRVSVSAGLGPQQDVAF